MADVEQSYADLLDERLAQTRAQQQALVTAIEELRAARSLTFTDDEHDPEGSTVSLLEAARERLASGTYGTWERGGRTIPPERLQARPEARRCVPRSR